MRMRMRMRMRFEAGAEEDFEAACGLLVARLVRWAGEQGLLVDGFMAEAALDYRHRATVDGRRAQGPEAREAIAAALDSAHPDRSGLDELRQLAVRVQAASGRRARNARRIAGKSRRKQHR